jgi:hypothetical protein
MSTKLGCKPITELFCQYFGQYDGYNPNKTASQNFGHALALVMPKFWWG